MPKVNYAGKTFDSELEVEYYKHLMADMNVISFTYHPKAPIQVTRNNTYTPDFVVYYSDSKDYLRCEIVETKGYSQFSYLRDNMIHEVMKSKTEQELKEWLGLNELDNSQYVRVVYRKIKYLKAYGFVDWDFKNPNTLANKRKEKIIEQKDEIKELRDFKKDAERYFRYHLKIVDNKKLTKPQKEWYSKYVEEMRGKYGDE